ncbi:MAG: CHAT domain-containing tetratricopeptide repeat protein [Thermoanaerobaculia bacterium]|nr:CHAT domain-containing tetratricopeptide repeat protein [Thermoanaerobaculia bacterium]
MADSDRSERRRKRRSRSAAVVALCAIAAAAPPPAPPGEPAATPLTAGEPVERRIEPGEGHLYELAVPAGSYLRLVAEQSVVDLAVEVLGPAGDRLAGGDVLGSLFLPEVVSLVTSGEGPLRVVVRTAPEEEQGGDYRLELEELRPAGPDDAWRVEAETHLQLGRDRLDRHGREGAAEAQRLLAGARAAARRAGDGALEGKIVHYLAGVHQAEGDLEATLETLRIALATRRAAGDLPGTHHSLDMIGHLLGSSGDREAAAEIHTEALAVARRSGRRDLEAKSLNNLGALDYWAGRLAEAGEKFDRALSIYRETGDDALRARTLANLGVIYRRLGRLDAADGAYREALELARRRGDVDNEITIVNNLGVLHRVRGEMQRALETYTDGIERASRLDLPRGKLADLHQNLGALWDRLGHPERAMESHETALALYRASGELAPQAGALMRIAWIHESTGEPEKMLPVLEEALRLAREAEDPREQALILATMGRARLELGEPLAAAPLFQAAAELAETATDANALNLALRNLGRAFTESGELVRARETLSRALDLSREVGDPIAEASTRFAQARLARREGRLGAAYDEMETALTAIERLRADLASQEMRASYFAGQQENYFFVADLLVERHEREPGGGFDRLAFEWSERSRARSFVELLAEAVAGAREGLTGELAERERALSQRIASTQSDLIGLLARPNPDPRRTAAARDDLDALLLELEQLEGELRREHPRYADVRYPQPASLAGVQRMLEPGDALLEYLLGEPRSLLFVVTRERFATLALPPADEIAALVRAARRALEKPGRGTLGSYLAVAPRLYDLLVRPAEPLLEGRVRLRIVPDGALHYLPFEALLTRATPRLSPEAYLVSRWSVSYVPSASALSEIRRNQREEAPARSRDLLAFGDPFVAEAEPGPDSATRALPAERWEWRRLPGTREEIEAIAGLFPAERVETYVGERARESLLKSRLGAVSPRFLHLASHAVVDARRPAYSAILMSPESEPGEDGLLQTHEVFRLAVPAELVVLSACETGLGRQVRGEGLVGLSRAFIYAGARAVTVSLWPVADRSTTELMLAFYREIEDGARMTEALRRAKLRLAGSPRFAHPYYWAPFVMMGDSA